MSAPPDVTRAAADHAAWNRRHRGESDVQRLDRNFVELLQELRVFRRRLKAELVQVTHRYALAGLVLLLAALLGSVQLAASLVIGHWSALLAAGLAVVFAGVWFGVPLRHRRGR